MPLYKTITADADTQILIWKIEESLSELEEGICLTPYCQNKLETLKTLEHRKQLLSIRQLLKIAGYADKDMDYDEWGKPHLKGNYYISVTHSFHFTGIIISKKPAGIDIEMQRDKIMRVANKFTPLEEYKTLANDEAVIRKLTIVWGAKEAIYKILSIQGISLLNHIYVEDFEFEDFKTSAQVNYLDKKYDFNINFLEFEQFTCVYALSSEPYEN